jgi:hypothetical protein
MGTGVSFGYVHSSLGVAYHNRKIDDEAYYAELARNYEIVERFKVAQEYEGASVLYLCEAISIYLQWKLEHPDKGQ